MHLFNKIIASVKGVMQRMGLLRVLKDVTDHKKVNANEADYNRIAEWKSEYIGNPSRLQLDYRHNGMDKKRQQLSMGLPKITAKYISKLLFNEKVKINIDKKYKDADDFVHDVLKTNGFVKNMERYIEYGAALGGFVIKVYHDGNKNVKVSFATADCVYPLSNDSENIDECVIANCFQKNDKYYTLLEWNEWEGETYVITTELYQSETEGDIGTKVPLSLLYDNIQPRVTVENLSRPLFVYIKPNIANNKNLTSPLGLSVYANALDTIKTIDLMFDAFFQEFKLGKKRIFVPAELLKTVEDELGRTYQYFDSDDEAMYAYNNDADDAKIVDISVEIRSSEFIESINAMLRIYAMQVGLSPGTFTFDENGLKTATEVVSEKSETYQTKNSHSQLLEQGIKELIISILEIGKLIGAYGKKDKNKDEDEDENKYKIPDESEMSVDFDDSIAQDEDTTINRYTNAKNNGMIPMLYALQRAWGITEEEAKTWLSMLQEEQQAKIPNNDMTGLFGEEE